MRNVTRRIVTGHDERGLSVIISEGAPPHILEKGTDVDFIELWNTRGAPPIIFANEPEPTEGSLTVPPPTGGTRFRINVLKPGHIKRLKPREDGRAPGMHRTQSIDYGIVLSGELYLILDNCERLLEPGDVVIQRGTDHAWENRSNVEASMAFILIDAQFDVALRDLLIKDSRLNPYK